MLQFRCAAASRFGKPCGMGKSTFSDCGRFDGDNFFNLLDGRLDERARRLVAAAVAQSFPCGGITAVSRSSGISRAAIHDGIHDLAEPELQQKSGGCGNLPSAQCRYRQGFVLHEPQGGEVGGDIIRT